MFPFAKASITVFAHNYSHFFRILYITSVFTVSHIPHRFLIDFFMRIHIFNTELLYRLPNLVMELISMVTKTPLVVLFLEIRFKIIPFCLLFFSSKFISNHVLNGFLKHHIPLVKIKVICQMQ